MNHTNTAEVNVEAFHLPPPDICPSRTETKPANITNTPNNFSITALIRNIL